MTDYLQFWRADAAVFLGPVAGGAAYVAPALASGVTRLALFCRQNDGLLLLTGEPGAGKTTILKWLGEQLDPDTHELLLTTMVQREHEAGWLTPRIAEHMGLEAGDGRDLAALIRATAARMDDLIAEQRKLIVAVDAAHFAETPAALDEVAAFLGLQALAGGCLTFLLAGDPGVVEVVQRTAGVAQRVALSLTVPPFDAPATAEYLEHRTKAAGFASPFDESGVDAVWTATRGIAAAVNGLAENCLVEAAARGTRRVTAEVVREAMRHLGRGPQTPAVGRTTVPPTTVTQATAAPAAAPSPPPPPPKAAVAGTSLTSLFKKP